MPRCPHCNERVHEGDLLNDTPEERLADARQDREKELRKYNGFQFVLSKEEAVRRAVGFRLEVEFEPLPRISVYGRTIALRPKFASEEELFGEAFEYLMDHGSGPSAVCVQ